jgi:hypothetical protein
MHSVVYGSLFKECEPPTHDYGSNNDMIWANTNFHVLWWQWGKDIIIKERTSMEGWK